MPPLDVRAPRVLHGGLLHHEHDRTQPRPCRSRNHEQNTQFPLKFSSDVQAFFLLAANRLLRRSSGKVRQVVFQTDRIVFPWKTSPRRDLNPLPVLYSGRQALFTLRLRAVSPPGRLKTPPAKPVALSQPSRRTGRHSACLANGTEIPPLHRLDSARWGAGCV